MGPPVLVVEIEIVLIHPALLQKNDLSQYESGVPSGENAYSGTRSLTVRT